MAPNSSNISNETNNNENKSYIVYNKGRLCLPFPTGEVLKLTGKLTLLQSPTSILSAPKPRKLDKFQKYCNDTVVKAGALIADTPYFSKFQKVGFPVLCSLTSPETKLESMKPYGLLMTVFFILDDILDNSKDFYWESVPAKTNEAIDAFVSIVYGEENQKETAKDFPIFTPICKLLQKLTNSVLELSNFSEDNAKYFFDSFSTYLEAVAWESTNAWKNPTWPTPSSLVTEEYFQQRELTIGLIPCLEILCLIQGIQLSPKIRRDPLFGEIGKIVARHVVIINDIFSLEKEIENNEKDNFILIKCQSSGVSGEECLAEAHLILESCVQKLLWYELKLEEKFQGDKNLQNYFQLCKNWMDGHIEWSLGSKRFGNSKFQIRDVK